MTDDIEMAGHTFRRKNGAWYTVWHSAGQQGFTRIIDHAPTLAPFLDEIERLRTENATARQMIDACPIDLGDGTSIRRVKETHQDFCRVHGSALCPESYMLNSNGHPWAEYADSWDETMRCNRRSALYVEATDD